MFDQEDYYSEEEDNLQLSKHIPSSKVLVPNSGSDFNHLTGQGETLLKMMQERGLDMNENQMRKLKASNASRQKDASKSKSKAGFFDGGASASFEELLKALNKALSSADPQQASVILSHILEKKNLSETDRNKFGVMKCKILFGLAAYQDCLAKAEIYLAKVINNHIVSATLSNYLAKSKAQMDLILDGYMDFLRAKSHLQAQKQCQLPREQKKDDDEFADSQIDTVARQIDHTQMEYNIKMAKYKNSTNLVYPYFLQLRHRQIKKIACGDYHTLFLVGSALNSPEGAFEVMGIGQNTVGQILGKSSTKVIKQPVVISDLSGKGIKNISASKQSSLAWTNQGLIYEWGIKDKRDDLINVTYNLGEKIVHLEKGYQHYAALTESGKFYVWGNIIFKGTSIFKQVIPVQQPSQNITCFSCGSSNVVAVDSYGDTFVFGSNQFGQLGMSGQLNAKSFKKLSNNFMGQIRKVICINDVTFLITKDEQLYFTGRISYNRDPIEKPRQGQFTGDIRFITSIVGTLGNYYLTNQTGDLYHWEVDSSVKFKIQRQNQKYCQRIVAASRGSLFKIRSLLVPELTKIKLKTEDLRSYQEINFQVQIFDQNGPYGNSNFVVAPKCQIFLSTYPIKGNDLMKENKLFLESVQFSNDDSKILLNEIIESRLASFILTRNEERPWVYNLSIISEQSGKFYFYVVMEDKNIYSQELIISVSEREKQLSDKTKKQKQLKQEERRRKAELQKQRLLDQKLKKEAEEEQKRKETQKRAEQAFKKYMREQEDMKARAEEDRKARKQLMTGGGFDLSKLRAKNLEKSQMVEKSNELMKSTESFLPDINARPNSRRKINLPSKNSGTLTSFESIKTVIEKPQIKNIQDLGSTNPNLFKSQSNKQKQGQKVLMSSSKGADSLNKTSTGGKMILKRGLSKGKK